MAAANARETLLGALLHGQHHSASDAIERFGGRAEALPQSLRRAHEFLYAHADEPLDLEQLATAAGTGIRALQLGFQRHFGTSISEMLRDIRLAHLNVRLAAASPDDSITDIAFELGFTHLSRMASAYRAKFGETPSATLRAMN
jgi:transcriptional regulator GlxA family with amidase domain